MFPVSLNNESKKMVRDLKTKIQNLEMYKNYYVTLDENDGGSNSITVTNKNSGLPLNKFMFFSHESNGNIQSISIHGDALVSHFNTIKSTKNIFGFKVIDIELVTENTAEPFVDIYIASYGYSILDSFMFYDNGNTKRESNDLKGAIEDFEMAIKLNPDHINAFCGLGLVYHSLQDYNKAIENFNNAISINDKYEKAYYYRARAKKEINDTSGAISDYNTVIRLNQNNANAYNNRGNIKFAKRDFNGAILDYNKALSLNPSFTSAIRNLEIAKKYISNNK